MANENPRVWFKSISIAYVRSFGEKQTIYFTEGGTENSKAARWNVILGDNGTGKTTVLKSLCLLTRDNQIALTYFGRNRVWDAYVEFVTSTQSQQRVFGLRMYNDPHRDGPRLSLRPQINQGDFNENPFLFAYGAVRRVGNSAITIEKTNSIHNLFDEGAALTNAEELLVQADYLALKEANENRTNNYIRIRQMLLRLFKNQISDIQIKAGVTNRHSPPGVFFTTPYEEVGLQDLSLGYKTLIAWMVDFAKGLLDRYPDSEHPLSEPAVCLVDEIDLHLHPKFQRTIIQFLTETFPNTQFIVTAHSPLIVVAAEERPLDTNIILLKREGDQTVIVNDPVDVSKWSVDQILNSDLFGHVPARSEPLTELRMERDTLLAKPKLTKKDNARLTELDEKIGFLPFGQDQAEIKAESIIQQLVDVLRKQRQVQ